MVSDIISSGCYLDSMSFGRRRRGTDGQHLGRCLGLCVGWALFGLLASACGGAASDTRGGGDGASGSDGGDDNTDSHESGDGEPVEFVVPLSPVDEGAVPFHLTQDEATGELLGPESEESTVVRLAVGEEYPDVISLSVSAIISPAFFVSDSLVLHTVSVPGDGVDVSIAEDDVLEFSTTTPGTYEVQVTAHATFEEGGESLEFSGRFIVEAIQVGGAEWNPCSFERVFVSGGALGYWRVYALDEDGEPFEPRNATVGRPADVIIRAEEGSTITATGGMEIVVITGPSQTVQLASNYGEMESIELIQPEDIDSMEPSFHFSEGGARGGGTSVESGGTIEQVLQDDPYISVFPGVRYKRTPLCGGPDPSLFVLRSTTPDVCVIEEKGCAERGCATSEYVPSTAAIVGEGTCSLELEAPSLHAGAGLSATYSVEIVAVTLR